jgi:hypothetical protein
MDELFYPRISVALKDAPPQLPIPRVIEADAQRVYKALQSNSASPVKVHTSDKNTVAQAPATALKTVFDVATKKLAWLQSRKASYATDKAITDDARLDNENGIIAMDSLLDAIVKRFGEDHDLTRTDTVTV